jgi:hypothetical protein
MDKKKIEFKSDHFGAIWEFENGALVEEILFGHAAIDCQFSTRFDVMEYFVTCPASARQGNFDVRQFGGSKNAAKRAAFLFAESL